MKNINPISLTTERKADENAPVTDTERHLLRGLIGSLQYAAVHTRPDLASSLSFLQSDINKAAVSTLIAAKKALHIAKKHHDVTIKIQPIKPNDLRFLAFSDASFASKVKPESHAGMIILATHKNTYPKTKLVPSVQSLGDQRKFRGLSQALYRQKLQLCQQP